MVAGRPCQQASPDAVRKKLEEYKLHRAIRAILLIDSEAPRVTVWRREHDAWNHHEQVGLDAVIDLPEIETTLPLAELYRDLTFEEG